VYFSFWRPVRALGRKALLIRFLISALYIVCLFISYACSLIIFFFTFSLLISSKEENRPALFWAGCHKRRLKLALVFFCLFSVVDHFVRLVNACFCCVGFSFHTISSQEIGLGKRLRNDLFGVEWDVKPQLSQLNFSFWRVGGCVQECVRSWLHSELDSLYSSDADPVLPLTRQFIDVLRDTSVILTPISSISQYFARLGVDYYKIASIACDSKVPC